ncbi:MAG: hypothetical protein WD577_11935 [Bacteroidales bacterium]
MRIRTPNYSSLSPNPKERELQASAETNYKQFLAIATYFRHHKILEELCTLDYFNSRLKKSKAYSYNDVRKWLFNSWNTERILLLNSSLLELDNNYFILQWSFPQAYYAAFASTLAFFKTVGYTENSHSAVLRKFGCLVAENKYPPGISFYCDGTKSNPHYHNINFTAIQSAMELNIFCYNSVQDKICQFLKTTRKIQLELKREESGMKKKFLTKSGQQKKNLAESEWRQISKSLGYTTILNMLYRKRIKANYQDVETFNYEGIRSHQINKCLNNIVNNINLTHETMIYKAIGFEEYNEIYQAYGKGKNIEFLDKRFQMINNTI